MALYKILIVKLQFNGATVTEYQSNIEAHAEMRTIKDGTPNDREEYGKANRTSLPTGESPVKVGSLCEKTLTPTTTPIGPCKLPRKFAAYCRNNYETWKPALFLEEPEDPNRRCHYAKQLVYPGTGVEYSPEELKSQKFITCLTEMQRLKEQSAQLKAEITVKTEVSEHITPEIQETGAVQQQQAQQNLESSAATVVANANEPTNSHKHRTSTNEQSEANGVEPLGQSFQHAISYSQTQIHLQQQNHQHNPYHHYPSNTINYNCQNEKQQQFQQQNKLENGSDDLEDQIEASTIRLGENKTIKIKFKKERQQHGHTIKGNNYVIEGIYQQEVINSSSFVFQLVKYECFLLLY